MDIRTANLQEVWALRKEVMYPEEDISFVQLEDDDKGIHLGLYIRNEMVSVVSLFINTGSIILP